MTNTAMQSHVRKLTMSQTWLRPVTVPTLVMRCNAVVNNGILEHSNFGDFLRWHGLFLAHVAQQNKTVATLTSYQGIFPTVVEEWIKSYCGTDRSVSPNGEKETLRFTPKGSKEGLKFTVDIFLKPGRQNSERGYEFGMSIVSHDASIDPFQALKSDGADFPALTFDEPDTIPAELTI